MTVTPDQFGYVPPDQYGNAYGGIPVGAPDYGSSNSWQYNRSVTSAAMRLDNNVYTSSKPLRSGPNYYGRNGYFYNGPSFNAMMYGNSEINQINALVQSWSDPIKRAYLDNFSGLLLKYGHTNSPGTLWAIAQAGFDPENDTIQQVLRADAQNVLQEDQATGPRSAGSIVEQTEDTDAASAWSPLQAITRNAFAALTMPLEATLGAIRGFGGAVSNPSDTSSLEAALQLGTLFMPTLGFLADEIVGKEFQDPWEQTEFGQTLLAAQNQGWAAFSEGQAGLDLGRAQAELLQLYPELAAQPREVFAAEAEAYAKEKNYYSEPGWFIDETSTVGEAQRQSTFKAWSIPGPNDELTAWTVGRGIFSNVGGPEWEGYATASGLVDLAVSVLLDPTIIGGKLGLPSKLIRVGSTAVRGAERPILVGAERAKANKAYETSVLQLSKAFDLAQTGAMNDARNAAFPVLQEAFGRPPTNKEIDEFLSEPEFFNKATLGRMQIEEVADVVYQAKRSQVTLESRERATADLNLGAGLSREARRAHLENSKYNGYLAENTIDDPAIVAAHQQDVARTVGLWDEYVGNSFDANGRFDAQMFENWVQTRFATAADDEDYYLFQNLGILYSTGLQANPSLTKAAFRDALVNETIDSRTWKPQRQIDPTKVEQDTARLYYDDEYAPGNVQGMIDTNVNGIVLQGIPDRQTPVLGAYGETGAVFYAPTGAQLKVVSATEEVSEPIRKRIRNRIFEIIDDPNMRPMQIDQSILPDDSMAAQVSRKMEQSADIRASLEDFLFNSPVITYGALLDVMVKYGLDVVFDDILGGLPKTMRIDGITDLNNIAGRTWIGDSTKVVGYQISETAQTAGVAAREVEDAETVLRGLTAQEQLLVGPRSQNVSDFAARTNARAEESVVNWERFESARNDAVFKANQEQIVLDGNLQKIDTEWAEPVSRLKSTIGWQAGLRYGPNGVTLDEKGMRQFLFGTGPLSSLAGKALDALSDFISPAKAEELRNELLRARETGDALSDEYIDYYTTAVGQIRMLSNGKWTSDTAKAIVDNAIMGGGRAGLLDVFAPRVGVDVTQGTIAKTLRSMPGDGVSTFRTWRTANPVVRRIIGNLTRDLPAGRVVNVLDADGVVEALMMYGRFARLDDADIAKFVGQVSMAEGTAGLPGASRNALAGMFNAINKTLIQELRDTAKTSKLGPLFQGASGERRLEQIAKKLENSTALWMGGRYKLREKATNDAATDTAAAKIIGDSGETIEFPSILLETEIANGFVNLPSVDEWRQAFNRVTLAMQRLDKVGVGWDKALDLYDDFFRASLLVFRVSYILRNSGEMQFRMFLNGHASVFNDPLVMTGMVIADERYARKLNKYNKRFEAAKSNLEKNAPKGAKISDDEVRAIVGEPPKQSKLVESFNMFSETALGANFTTLDKDLAAANHLQDFFALIRESSSMIDPRVYKYAARTGWFPVEFGNVNFYDGLANELIMLETSVLPKLVLGKTGGRYGGQIDEPTQRLIAQEFMYSAQYQGLREQLLSGDDQFARIFKDEDAAVDFLFTNENSVLNRIIRYTGNDADLLDFIRTGAIRDGNDVLVPRTLPQPRERIERLASVVQKKIDGDAALKNHMEQNKVTVPWNDFGDSQKRGLGIFDFFFETANKLERLGSVGPEFRQAYWDRVAELAPGVRASDVGTMLDAAQTTLRPLKRLVGGKAVNFGKNHPAWEALDKARRENSDGLLTAEEIHQLAARHASQVVSDLFYDAARRNNFWYQLRLLTPFGQAYGNTLKTWGALGKKRPIQVYKVAKAINALQERDSQAIYELGQELGAYSNVAEGSAPFEQDLNGGFFYSNNQGQTTFMLPFLGRAASLPIGVWGTMNGIDTSGFGVDYESPAQSLNLAFGGESILPGASPLVPFLLSAGPSDNSVISKARELSAPFGDKDLVSSAAPAWFQRNLAGLGVIPGIGGIANSALGNILSPGLKGKNLNDAGAMLATTNGYENFWQDPNVQQRFKEDSEELASLLSLIQGVTQNISPSSPQLQTSAVFAPPSGERTDMTAKQYGIAFISLLYSLSYMPRNGWDGALAQQELLSDFGPGALYAIVSNLKGFTRMPKSAALDWAKRNPETSKSWRDTFPLFYPGGDMAQAEAVRWLSTEGFYEPIYKNPDDVQAEVMRSFERIQNLHLDAKYANNLISEQEYEQAKTELSERYRLSGSNVITILDYGAELEKFNVFAQLPEVSGSEAAVGFRKAWILREQALQRVREGLGDPDAGLGSEAASAVFAKYLSDIDTIVQEYPDFKLLATYFKKEWR